MNERQTQATYGKVQGNYELPEIRQNLCGWLCLFHFRQLNFVAPSVLVELWLV